MQGRVFVLFALLAVAFAGQSYTVTPLADSVVYTGTLDVQTSSADGYDVEIFSFFVPENASSVNITFSNLDSDVCSYVSLYVKQGGLPCSNDQYTLSQYRCGQGNDLGNGISGDLSTLFVAGNYEYLFEYQVNTYWYIAIGRYYSSEYSYACPYSVSVEVNSSCPTGAIGIPYGLSSYYYSQCSPQYTVVSTTYPATYSIVAAEDTYPMFKLSIPLDTGNIYFTVNATTTSLYIYGKSYGGPSSYTYNCYEGSYTTVGNYYVYDVVCYTPRAGDFFVVIDDQYDAYNATITFNAPVTCANGTGGWNCSFVSVPFSGSSFTATIPYYSTASYLSDAFYYFYVDIPANYSSNALTVSADTGAGSGIFFYRRNGYPEYSSYYGYESTYEYYSTPHTYTLNQFD